MIQYPLIARVKVFSIFLVFIVSFIPATIVLATTKKGESHNELQSSHTTWQLLSSNFSDAVFTDVSFLNSTHGWITGRATSEVGSNAIVLHTEDRGDSWQLQYNRESQRISKMDVVNEHTIWVNGFGSLFYSLDGGLTWNESVVLEGMAGMSTVKFKNMTHGWTSNNGILYQTTDGGKSWEIVTGYDFDDSPRMMQILSPLDIWAVGFGGIYHSVDGGMTWVNSSNIGGWALDFVSTSEGWVIGDNRLAHTTDGNWWNELIVPMRAPLFRLRSPFCSDIQFIDENNGWIVGTEIHVMYTPDGGSNWYEQSVPSEVNSRIKAVDFINQTHGWAVGWDGVIMRTRIGNTLGNRLWYGLTDPLFLSLLVIVSSSSIIGIVLIHRWRRKSRLTETKSHPPIID